VVSRAQLAALAVSHAAVDVWVRRRRLRVVHRGVYAVGGAVLSREGRWLAAVLACGDRAVLSHVSAAVHWGLLQYDAPRPVVTALASRRGAPGIRLHRSRSLDAQDTTSHDGIPVTTLARTLLDIAADVPDSHLERALAQAEKLQLYDHNAITDAIAGANGHRGTNRLTKAIAADPQFTRSELEIRMRRLARRHGLPRPLCNHVLDAPDHPGLEADFYFPTHHLVVETDGFEAHRTRQAFEDDRAKDAALTAAGYTVVRFTWRQVRDDPQTVADRLTAIMRLAPAPRRRARGGPARG
jgi:hypothetical protein